LTGKEPSRHTEQGFRDYQDRGYTISAGEWQGDVHAVGVPVRDIGGEQVMAFNCGPRPVKLVQQIDSNLGRR